MKHSNLFVSVILHFINEHYRKTNKRGKKQQNKTKQKQKVKTKKNKREMKLIARPLPFYFQRNINQLCDQQDAISLITSVC